MSTEPYRPIIKSKHNVPWIVRVRDIILTILVWLLYFYFMYETFDFVRDLVDAARPGIHSSAQFSALEFLDSLASYLIIMLMILVVFTAWSLYNTLRFAGRSRRRASAPVTVEQLAAVHLLPASRVKAWQKARIMVMHHDKNGRLTEVQTDKT